MRLLVSSLLVLTLVAPRVVRADDAVPPGARLTEPDKKDPRVAPPNRKLRREVGIGLVIGAAALSIIGFGLLGGAAKANSDIFAGNQYHPKKVDLRDNLQIGDAVMFSASVVAFVPGMVLIWDR